VTHPIIDAYLRSDLFGRLIFLSLFILSIISWIILIYKVWLSRTVNKSSDHFKKVFLLKKRQPLHLEFRQVITKGNIPHPFLELYRTVKTHTLEILKKNKIYGKKSDEESLSNYLSSTDIEQIGAQVSATIHHERKKLQSNLYILSTIASLAPLLGLLGTVWGISVTFAQLPNSSNVLNNEAVLSGLAMALGTTVLGIVVAIPALIAYNFLKSQVNDYVVKMDGFVQEMLSAVEIQYRAVDVKVVV
jgi:biopolymer transport protein TolQ